MDEFQVVLPGDPKHLELGGKFYKSIYDWKLTEKDLNKAARELGETNERKERCLQELKEKLSNASHIRFRQDDFYLLRFLRIRKYDVTRAYQNVKLFFEHRKKHSCFFALPPELKSVQELNWTTGLPYTDEEGRVIILLNFNRWNPHEKTFEEMMQAASTVCDLVIMNPKCQVNGIVAIYDFGGITARHVSELLWKGRLLAAVPFALNGYPWRIKKWILLNTNQFVKGIYSILRPLLPKKIRERSFLLGSDMSELHQHVNPALLPKRLKGNLEEEECDMTQHVLNNLDYLQYERTFIYK